MVPNRPRGDDADMLTDLHNDLRMRVALGFLASALVLLTAGAFG
jgi:hypothetical protein